MPKLEREADVRRQHADEALEALKIEVEVRLKLKEDRAELVAEAAGGLDPRSIDFGSTDRRLMWVT